MAKALRSLESGEHDLRTEAAKAIHECPLLLTFRAVDYAAHHAVAQHCQLDAASLELTDVPPLGLTKLRGLAPCGIPSSRLDDEGNLGGVEPAVRGVVVQPGRDRPTLGPARRQHQHYRHDQCREQDGYVRRGQRS